MAQVRPAEAKEAREPDIVVTARRRAEALQDVPDSVTAFTAQLIEDARIRKADDFLAMTPNVEFLPAQSPGNFQVTVRGISMTSLGEAPVVMVIDGVTLPYPNAFNTPLFDIANIQVLKGPQGALYGQNAIGGAIVVNTKQPTNDFAGQLTGSIGAHGENGVIASISGPIVPDKLLFRAAVFHSRFGGDFRYAYGDRRRQNFTNDKTARLGLTANFADNLSLVLTGTYSRTSAGGGTLVPETLSPRSNIPGVSTAALNALLVIGEPNQDLQSRTYRRVLSGSGRLVWNLGFAELSLVTAGVGIKEDNLQDADVSSIPFVGGTQGSKVDAFSEELRLTSPSENRFRWIVTGFLQRTKRELSQNIGVNRTLLTTGNTNPAAALVVPSSVLNRIQHLDSNAIAVQANYDITPKLELTLAGRYDSDPRDQRTVSQVPAVASVYLKRTFKKFQPKASIAFKPTADQTYYATYAQGFRAGGFNLTTTAALQPVFDAEDTKTLEVGAKFNLFDHRATLNLAGYTTRYANQQLTLTTVSAGGALSQGVFTVDSSRIRGLEVELQARPVAGLEFGFGGGLQSGKIRRFGNSLSGASFNPSAYVGNNVPLQSKYTLTTSAQYTFPVTSKIEAYLRGELDRKGRLYWYADNRISRSPFNLVNVKAGIRSGNLELSVYGRNIFDINYNTSYFDNIFVGAPGGFDFGFRGDKARYGAELTYRF